MTNQPKYPDIVIQLSGEDGNAFFIMGRVRKALRRANVSVTEIEQYIQQSTSGDYDNLLRVAMEWVTCE